MVDQKRWSIAFLSPHRSSDQASRPDDRATVIIGLTGGIRLGDDPDPSFRRPTIGVQDDPPDADVIDLHTLSTRVVGTPASNPDQDK